MASNTLKCLRAENKRLQSLVAKLAGTVETMHLQLKQKEDDLTKRRIEVATLHRACAKNKSRIRIAPVQRPPIDLQAATPLKTTTIQQTVLLSTTTKDALCSRCQKSKHVFGELEKAVETFAEKLNAAIAEREAQFNTTLKEKEGEIEQLVAALAEKEREAEETRAGMEKQTAREKERVWQGYEDMIREINEEKLHKQRRLEQTFRELEEERIQRVRLQEQRIVVIRRQRTGVADAA